MQPPSRVILKDGDLTKAVEVLVVGCGITKANLLQDGRVRSRIAVMRPIKVIFEQNDLKKEKKMVPFQENPCRMVLIVSAATLVK